MMKQLYIFRHGQTDWNKIHKFQGRTDIHLNEQGQQDALKLAEQLIPFNLELIITSDLSRAMQTALIVNMKTGAPMKIDPRLQEVFMGEGETKSYDEAKEIWGADTIKNWYDLTHPFHFPGGESKQEVQKRVISALKDIVATEKATRIGISTHGHVLLMIMAYIDLQKANGMKIPNGSFVELFTDDGESFKIGSSSFD